MSKCKIVIIIGVSGVGKSTIAQRLTEKLNLPYLDADNFHPSRNIQKMKSGNPLTDDDREPWLLNMNEALIKANQDNGAILACSALKEKYRNQLASNINVPIDWVVLKGDFELIKNRMEARDHFMPTDLLRSQFDTWEEPDYGLKINISQNPEKIVERIMEKINNGEKAEIGLIGLGVMGKSLSRNIANNGFSISVFNRHVEGKEENVALDFAQAHNELNAEFAFDKMEDFIDSLSSPKKVFLMVNAGKSVDEVIYELTKYLSPGDIIIDGGNSHYKDTELRFNTLKAQGIHFLGTGVSGGEEGALKGPSIMPGGSHAAFDAVEQILNAIAAKDSVGTNCCTYIGNGGSGHFVKMIHNGIEYAEMQLIAEVYGILRHSMSKTLAEISVIFSSWNDTTRNSYLLEITADILLKKEGENYLIDLILDKAGNKGTGGWTTIAACELGVAIPTLTAALFARYQSSQLESRIRASEIYPSKKVSNNFDLEKLSKAYQLARIINHHQGFDLIAQASLDHGWNINYQELARVWTNGCIIRSKLMEAISKMNFSDGSLLLNPSIKQTVLNSRDSLIELAAYLPQTNVSAPCLLSTLSYLNGFTEKRSLANIIQAQRDYFGAHTYERIDAPSGETFHTNWI